MMEAQIKRKKSEKNGFPSIRDLSISSEKMKALPKPVILE
jgi:hypothetical protein